MKKIILLLCFVPFIGFSQDCKFEKNEIDSFSKSKTIKTKSRVIVDIFSPTTSVVFQFLFDKQPYIIIDIDFAGFKKFSVNAENNILFLLKNEEVITLNIGKLVEGDHTGGLGFGPMTKFKFTLPITIEELNKIRTIGLQKIRLENTDDAINFDVKSKKNVDKINLILDCFINEIPK